MWHWSILGCSSGLAQAWYSIHNTSGYWVWTLGHLRKENCFVLPAGHRDTDLVCVKQLSSATGIGLILLKSNHPNLIGVIPFSLRLETRNYHSFDFLLEFVHGLASCLWHSPHSPTSTVDRLIQLKDPLAPHRANFSADVLALSNLHAKLKQISLSRQEPRGICKLSVLPPGSFIHKRYTVQHIVVGFNQILLLPKGQNAELPHLLRPSEDYLNLKMTSEDDGLKGDTLSLSWRERLSFRPVLTLNDLAICVVEDLPLCSTNQIFFLLRLMYVDVIDLSLLLFHCHNYLFMYALSPIYYTFYCIWLFLWHFADSLCCTDETKFLGSLGFHEVWWWYLLHLPAAKVHLKKKKKRLVSSLMTTITFRGAAVAFSPPTSTQRVLLSLFLPDRQYLMLKGGGKKPKKPEGRLTNCKRRSLEVSPRFWTRPILYIICTT